MSDDAEEREFKQFKHLELHGLPPYNRLSAAVGCAPSFQRVGIQIGPIKGHYGSDSAIYLTRAEARRLADWIKEQCDGDDHA